MSVYADTVRERVLTPEAMEDVQRAATLLRAAAPIMREAIGLLAPLEWAYADVCSEILAAGGRISDEEADRVRAGVYQEAVDLAHDILDVASRIS